MPAVIEPRAQYLTSGRSKAGCTYRYRLSCSIKRVSAGRFSTNTGGNRTTDPVISRPADKRLVLFPPELSGVPMMLI